MKLQLIPPLLLALVASDLRASNDWREIRLEDAGTRASSEKEVQIRGTWVAKREYASPRVARINAVQFNCYRESMVCLESLAEVQQLKGQPADSSPTIFSFTINYKVQEWTDRQIVAIRVNPRGGPINQKVSIGLKDPTMTMEWKEGPLDDGYFSPGIQVYGLAIKYPY